MPCFEVGLSPKVASGDNNEILEFPNEHLGSGAQC